MEPSKKILIIEDDEIFSELLRETISDFLNNNDHDVMITNDYYHGLTLIQNYHWDFVLSDQQLGQKNGYQLMGSDLLKIAQNKGIHCTLYSSEPDYQTTAKKIGCHFICKSCGIFKIVAHIQSQLEPMSDLISRASSL